MTRALAEHVASATRRPLPVDVVEKASWHILDTVAAIVSGSELAAGRLAIRYAAGLGGRQEALVIGSDIVTTAVNAALANGMLAHADETDDSHAPSLTHPGCAVVPAALAVAEREGRSGRDFLRAVVVGYDLCARIGMALGGEAFFVRHHSSHSFGGVFGAAAAAGALLDLDADRACHLFSYAVQLASGNACWRRDPEHIEKAFDFGGMPANAGTLAATMVAFGFTGASEPLEGMPGLFSAFREHAQPDLAVAGLGVRHEIARTAIKKWSVGSPIQAALDSLEALIARDRFRLEDVEDVLVHLPQHSAPVVDDRPMPDVNVQQQLALLLRDREVTFRSSHDRALMQDPEIVALRRRIRVVPRADEDFVRHPRQAIVDVRLSDGRLLSHQTLHVRGTPDNPMSRNEVSTKALDLIGPVLGPERGATLVERLLQVDELPSVLELRPLLRGKG